MRLYSCVLLHHITFVWYLWFNIKKWNIWRRNKKILCQMMILRCMLTLANCDWVELLPKIYSTAAPSKLVKNAWLYDVARKLFHQTHFPVYNSYSNSHGSAALQYNGLARAIQQGIQTRYFHVKSSEELFILNNANGYQFHFRLYFF